jgi:hypothetical protein
MIIFSYISSISTPVISIYSARKLSRSPFSFHTTPASTLTLNFDSALPPAALKGDDNRDGGDNDGDDEEDEDDEANKNDDKNEVEEEEKEEKKNGDGDRDKVDKSDAEEDEEEIKVTAFVDSHRICRRMLLSYMQ